MAAGGDRHFTIGDAMILVAAAALGFALMRLPPWNYSYEAPDPRTALLWRFFNATTPLILALAPAWLVLRLRRPRPRLHALLRRPGSASGFAALAASIACAVLGLGSLSMRVPGSVPYWMLCGFGDVGYMVLGCLAALLLSRRSRMVCGWIEWIGLGIGLHWLSSLAYQVSTPILHPLLPSVW